MATSESEGRLFLQNESIRIDSHNESIANWNALVAKPAEWIAALLFFLSAVTTHSPTLRHVLCVAKPAEWIAALLFFLSLVASLRITNRSFKHAAPLVSGIKSQLLAPISWKRSNQISEYKRGLSVAGRWLDVAGCSRLSNVGVKTLATACTHLQHLDLSSTPVNHHRCVLTPGCTHLQHLDLSSTPANHHRCALTHLQHLDLSNTPANHRR